MITLGTTFGFESMSFDGPAIRAIVKAVDAAHPEPLLFFEPLFLLDLAALPAWRALVPLSENDSCLVPVAISLHADGRDPLDP